MVGKLRATESAIHNYTRHYALKISLQAPFQKAACGRSGHSSSYTISGAICQQINWRIMLAYISVLTRLFYLQISATMSRKLERHGIRIEWKVTIRYNPEITWRFGVRCQFFFRALRTFYLKIPRRFSDTLKRTFWICPHGNLKILSRYDDRRIFFRVNNGFWEWSLKHDLNDCRRRKERKANREISSGRQIPVSESFELICRSCRLAKVKKHEVFGVWGYTKGLWSLLN